MTELSLWEKVGFTDNKKRAMMFVKGKQKMDESYAWIRSTMIQGKQLQELLNQKREKEKELDSEKEELENKIKEHTQMLNIHEGLVEDAKGKQKQSESQKKAFIEEKNNEYKECEVKLYVQQREMIRQYAIVQSSHEDERSQCLRLMNKIQQETQKSRKCASFRNQSHSL